jgi:hypothetical protein
VDVQIALFGEEHGLARQLVREIKLRPGGEVIGGQDFRLRDHGQAVAFAGFGILFPVVDSVDVFPRPPQPPVPTVVVRLESRHDPAVDGRERMKVGFWFPGVMDEPPDDLAVVGESEGGFRLLPNKGPANGRFVRRQFTRQREHTRGENKSDACSHLPTFTVGLPREFQQWSNRALAAGWEIPQMRACIRAF